LIGQNLNDTPSQLVVDELEVIGAEDRGRHIRQQEVARIERDRDAAFGYIVDRLAITGQRGG
jgi:hypothetical protein